eukprot:1156383-Pelagomonas_calceolata.AAC.9
MLQQTNHQVPPIGDESGVTQIKRLPSGKSLGFPMGKSLGSMQCHWINNVNWLFNPPMPLEIKQYGRAFGCRMRCCQRPMSVRREKPWVIAVCKMDERRSRWTRTCAGK